MIEEYQSKCFLCKKKKEKDILVEVYWCPDSLSTSRSYEGYQPQRFMVCFGCIVEKKMTANLGLVFEDDEVCKTYLDLDELPCIPAFPSFR